MAPPSIIDNDEKMAPPLTVNTRFFAYANISQKFTNTHHPSGYAMIHEAH
jgi:hypothetical protein